MMRALASFPLHVDGPGFVIYSPFAMESVTPSSNFLAEHFTDPADVAESVRAGRLAGCCTGSPGNYRFELFDSAPDLPTLARFPWWIRLAIVVRDRTVCVRDIFDFARWDPSCGGSQRIELPDGFYRLAVGTRPTNSGIVGDDQDIAVAFEHVAVLPELTWTGVPFLGKE